MFNGTILIAMTIEMPSRVRFYINSTVYIDNVNTQRQRYPRITLKILTKLDSSRQPTLSPLFEGAADKLHFRLILRMGRQNVNTATPLHYVLVSTSLVAAVKRGGVGYT